jgi:CSLREA domain-containing protein
MKQIGHAASRLILCLGLVLSFTAAASARGGVPAANTRGSCGASAPASVRAQGNVFTVITAADTDDGRCDSSACSLRDAIKAANASPGPDTIRFSVGSGVFAIQPGSPLPPITDSVTIDGTSQPG